MRLRANLIIRGRRDWRRRPLRTAPYEMTHRRQIVVGSAAWLIAASAAAATKRAKGAKKVALVDDGAPDVVTYGLREDVVRFAEGVAERRELRSGVGEEGARTGALHPGRDALHHAADDRHGEELGRLPRPFRRADPHSCRQSPSGAPTSAGSARPRTCTACRPRSSSGSSASSRFSAGRWATSASSTRWRRWRSISRAAARTAAPSSRTSSRPGSSSARAKASIRSPGAAATPARSAWRSSCRRASTSTRSTSTATATSTCTPTPPT